MFIKKALPGVPQLYVHGEIHAAYQRMHFCIIQSHDPPPIHGKLQYLLLFIFKPFFKSILPFWAVDDLKEVTSLRL